MWFRENIRDPLNGSPEVFLATVAFRWFNRISTGEIIKDLLLDGWDSDKAKSLLTDVRPVVTGAYIIKTPNGMKKLDGVCWCIDQVAQGAPRLLQNWDHTATMEGAHKVVKEFPFLGKFMAYEIVCDLRYTHLLENADDIYTWASPGPGAARGISRILTDDPKSFSYGSKKDHEVLLQSMRGLLLQAGDGDLWPSHWPKWDMRTVEHTLCEFDKYERCRLGQGRMKQKFRAPKG